MQHNSTVCFQPFKNPVYIFKNRHILDHQWNFFPFFTVLSSVIYGIPGEQPAAMQHGNSGERAAPAQACGVLAAALLSLTSHDARRAILRLLAVVTCALVFP